MTLNRLKPGKSFDLQGFRAALREILSDPLCERIVVAVIVLNAITLGLETSATAVSYAGGILSMLDTIILVFFVVEIATRIFAFGGSFWRDPWSVFDFLVVGITLVPATGNLSILRALRIIRALRLVSAIPSVRRVVGGLLSAIPSMGSVILLLLLVNYIFAVMGTKLFADEFPENFGTIGASFFTFFQIMTLEGWAQEIVRPVMDKHPWAWVLFIPYIVFVVFAVLNLFIGIIVDAMQNQADEVREADAEAAELDHRELLSEIGALRAEIKAIRADTEKVVAVVSRADGS
ncbi:MAG: ion transporter [Hyphomicrobiaceae bacterium]